MSTSVEHVRNKAIVVINKHHVITNPTTVQTVRIITFEKTSSFSLLSSHQTHWHLTTEIYQHGNVFLPVYRSACK